VPPPNHDVALDLATITVSRDTTSPQAARQVKGAVRPQKTFGCTETSMKLFRWLNAWVSRNLRAIEMVGVLMRIFSFSLVSWLGPASPFLFVWAFNTADAVMLSWCAMIKKDSAYTILNVFWVGVGVVGMVRAGGFTSH
jgi:hypothetical protein